MPDAKISALPTATTPLSGAEVLPIVQGGTTDQVSVANLTAGRAVAAAGLTVAANTSGDAVRITQTGAGNALVVEDSANPDATPFVVDASGNVIAGTTQSYSVGTIGALPLVQVHGITNVNAPSGYSATNWASSSGAPQFSFAKSRSGLIGSHTVVNSTDTLGSLVFYGSDGTNFITAASINGTVDGTPGASDMPGRLVFSTTADGASSPTERMRINSAGFTSLTGSFGRGAPVTKTGNFTLAATENWVICNGAGSITVTLPTASSWTGREVMIKTIAAQTVVSASSNVVPLDGAAAGTAILAATAGKWATLVSDGTNWVIMQAN